MPIAAKLDEFGKPAWILLMILGFVWWWPLGLVMLAFIIGSGRMGCARLRRSAINASNSVLSLATRSRKPDAVYL